MRGTGTGGNVSWGKSFCLLWCWSDISFDDTCNASKQLAALPLSDRVSVIKHDGLPFLTQTLTQIPTPPTPSPSIRSTLDFSIRHVWIVVLSNHLGKNTRAEKSPTWVKPHLDFDESLQEQKTAMSCGRARQTASESLRDELRWCYTHQAQWQPRWIGFVSLFLFYFFQATTHSARAATELQ